jgi:hypothetical protein
MTEFYRKMLTEQVFVIAKTFKGDEDVFIHIRNYDIGPKGLRPSERGVKLSLEHWKHLECKMNIIDETLSDIQEGRNTHFSVHLGSNIYIEVDTEFGGVDIRHWYWCKDSASVKPTRRGIFLLPEQWNILVSCCKDIEEAIPELEHIELCFDNHHNEASACTFCTPNPVKDSYDVNN